MSSLRAEVYGCTGSYRYRPASTKAEGTNCTVRDQFDPEASDANREYPVKIMTPETHPEICNQYNFSKW
jgi:hypothetical protein